MLDAVPSRFANFCIGLGKFCSGSDGPDHHGNPKPNAEVPIAPPCHCWFFDFVKKRVVPYRCKTKSLLSWKSGVNSRNEGLPSWTTKEV